MIHFVIGGARSGKSAYAQQMVEQLSGHNTSPVIYIATAENIDDEMDKRIAHHKTNRPEGWCVKEVPLDLVSQLTSCSDSQVILVDCLTLWLNNQLHYYPEQDFDVLFEQLRNALTHCKGNVVLVANEVGLGVIPMGDISRRFVDLAGWLNQAVAQVSTQVTFMAAGLPLTMKLQETA